MTIIQEWNCDDLGTMKLPEFISMLQSIMDEAPCAADEITIRFFQYGDCWDGYGEAEVTVERPQTKEEEEVERQERDRRQKEYQERVFLQELETYNRLRAKFDEAMAGPRDAG